MRISVFSNFLTANPIVYDELILRFPSISFDHCSVPGPTLPLYLRNLKLFYKPGEDYAPVVEYLLSKGFEQVTLPTKKVMVNKSQSIITPLCTLGDHHLLSKISSPLFEQSITYTDGNQLLQLKGSESLIVERKGENYILSLKTVKQNTDYIEEPVFNDRLIFNYVGDD